MTEAEYAAIGRRVEKTAPDKTHTGREWSAAITDRAALWELCERLIGKIVYGCEGRWYALLDENLVDQPTREAAVAALLESLGGTDG